MRLAADNSCLDGAKTRRNLSSSRPARGPGTAVVGRNQGHARSNWDGHKQVCFPGHPENLAKFVLHAGDGVVSLAAPSPHRVSPWTCTDFQSLQGLYDPRAGARCLRVGFVVHIKGQADPPDCPAGSAVAGQPAASRRLWLRGQYGGRNGILIQMPDRSRAGSRNPASRHRPPACRRLYGAGWSSLPPDPRAACGHPGAVRNGNVAEEGQQVARGMGDLPTETALLGPTARAAEPVFQADLRRPGPGLCHRRPRLPTPACDFERKLYVIRKRVEHAVRGSGPAEKRASASSACRHTLTYKGMADGEPDRVECFPICRIRAGIRAGAGSPAIQHQHFPSCHWRTRSAISRHNGEINHVTRQHELDARPRRPAAIDVLGEDLPKSNSNDHPRRRSDQRFYFDQPRAGVSRDGGTVPASRDPHDDSGAVERSCQHERRSQAFVTQYPFLAHGTVGRTAR